ncbi:MAG: sigma 54-interacting transcriptional regulator [Sandaracinobacteroides sp.]
MDRQQEAGGKPHQPAGLAKASAARTAGQPVAQDPVAQDPASRSLLALAAPAAGSDATSLITGPSGAGKDVLARYLHARSPRHAAPFLAVNCAALPEAMLEALLFGHVRGAFTGAADAAPGLFRAAGDGTLFLDELGELPIAMQAKLLRAVEQREVLPLGATAPVPVAARLVAATNRDLAAEVAAGRFRADLYWRLSVFPLEVRALAQRPLDILPLVDRLLGDTPHSFSPALRGRLLAHPWPGNVRELQNLLERAKILAGGEPVTDRHICLPEAQAPVPALPDRLRLHEAEVLGVALAETGGRHREAARRLGISERTLRYKLAAQAGRPRASAARAILQ